MRAGKRRAAPLREGSPKPSPETPGRKSGDAPSTLGHRELPPGSVPECHRAPLPDTCPHCRGQQVGTGTGEQFHTEIPDSQWSASSSSVVFPRQLIALFAEAIHGHNQLAGRVERAEKRERQRSGMGDRLLALCAGHRSDWVRDVGARPLPAVGEPVHVRGRSNGGGDELESGAGTPPGGGQPQRVVWERDTCRGRHPTGVHVRVREMPSARPCHARLPQGGTPGRGQSSTPRPHPATGAIKKYPKTNQRAKSL